ncbi:MAG: RluA family pseudouridine synthase [Patescibacteria group bacterium]
MKISVIYENKDFLALNKPAGVLVHRTNSKRKEEALTDWLVSNYPEVKNIGDDFENRPGIVHRLDKDTSGILLVPKTQEYFHYLKNLFQKHEVQKTYLALVRGVIEDNEGVIDKPIGLKPGTVKRTVFTKSAKMIKEAVTRYKVMEKLPTHALLEVYPKTGRTHQIRVHLASISHPVVGDKVYGGKDNSLDRLFLHAYSVEFSPEPGKNLKLTADLPDDLTQYLRSAKLAGQ